MPAKKSRKKKSGDQLLTKRQFKTKSSLGKKRSIGPASGSNPQKFQRRLEASQAKVVMNGVAYYKCPACPKLLSTSYNYFAHKNTHAHARPCKCDMCGKSFTASSSLTRHVREVHYQIKNYGCGFCERKLASKIARDEHERTHTNERPNVCDTCGKSFRQRASLSVHRRFHLKNYQFNCQLCSREFRRKQDLQRHELTHTDERPYGCEQCSKRFRSSASASRHRQIHDHAKLACNECGQTCAGEKCLRSHMRSAHNVEPSPTPSKMSVESTSDGNSFVYMCGICEKLYKSESDLRSHLNEDHVDSTDFRSLNPLRYECNVCRKTYIQKENLINHMQSHASTLSGEDAVVERCKVFRNQMLGFKCEKCGQVLSNRRTFLRHIRVHTNERPVICHICGKSYRIEDDLKRHIDDVHMKIKRFACDLCNKPFAAKATRDAHRRIHTGEKPFTCGTCGKTFRSINLLGIHKRVHTDYRPHACSYCEKAFRNKQKLTIHECIHTGIRPFACDVCGKLFAAKGEARRHRSVHFADKPFLCSECGLGFRLNRYLKTHIKTHHEARVDTAEEPMEKN